MGRYVCVYVCMCIFVGTQADHIHAFQKQLSMSRPWSRSEAVLDLESFVGSYWGITGTLTRRFLCVNAGFS